MHCNVYGRVSPFPTGKGQPPPSNSNEWTIMDSGNEVMGLRLPNARGYAHVSGDEGDE